MRSLLHLLQYGVAAAYVVLGLVACYQWFRRRDAARGYLALAIGGLGFVSLAGQLQTFIASEQPFSGILEDITIVVFAVSGFAVLLFRGTFIPVGRVFRNVVLAALVVTTALAVVAGLPTGANVQPTPFQNAITIALILGWSVCVGEPIIRFWIRAGDRPRVQKSRLRALSLGFSGLVGIILVSVLAGAAVRSLAAQIIIELIALATVPLLYASFSPPTWLRRTWREREESQYRTAVQDLLLFSPTRQALAEKAVEWATRLVGADSAALIEPDGGVIATTRMPDQRLKTLIETAPAPGSGTNVFYLPARERESLISLDLPTKRGIVRMLVVSGPFTPVFGTDEVNRLEGYASAVTAGLDRTSLTERIAALERTKTQFLNLASHELRGPVTVLRGYLSMIERGALAAEQMKDIMPVLVAKAEEMNLMVEQMIEASRLEEGKVELRLRRCDLRELVTRSVELMKPLADSEHPIRVNAPKAPIPVEVDPDRISTILTNLIDNAVKYSPNGGEVRCNVQRNGTHAQVSVTDSGIGIDEAQMPHLFTRFGRIVTSETSSIRGTGLGLYLARELARLHGGDITVESQPGKGSTFVMAVPLAG